MIPSEYSYMTNPALFSAQELSASRQTSIHLFGWDCRPPPLTAVLFPGRGRFPERLLSAHGRRSVSPFVKKERLNYLGRSLTTSSHKEPASTTNGPGCFSSVSSSCSGSLFRMISIPRVSTNKSLWQSFLPFVIHYVLWAVRPWFSKWFQDELKAALWAELGKTGTGIAFCCSLPFLTRAASLSTQVFSGAVSFRDREHFINAKPKQTTMTRKCQIILHIDHWQVKIINSCLYLINLKIQIKIFMHIFVVNSYIMVGWK